MPRASNAALQTIQPVAPVRATKGNGPNACFITMTPLYLSITSTRSISLHLPSHSDSFNRSYENLTSSAVSSPYPPSHIRPGFSLNAICKGSVYAILSAAADASHSQESPRRISINVGMIAFSVVVSQPPIM